MTDKTVKLAEEEKRINEERRNRISEITLRIEKILVDENISLEEWYGITELFRGRAEQVISDLKISEIKNRYDRQ